MKESPLASRSDAVNAADGREGAPGSRPEAPSAGLVHGLAIAQDSANTRRAYRSDWRQFESWCRRHGFDARQPDPQVVGRYLTAAVDGSPDGAKPVSVATLERRLAALGAQYRTVGLTLDRTGHIADLMAGIRRTRSKPPKQKEALLAADIRRMVGSLGQNLRGFRDKAILLVGFAGGLRRSEIVGLDCAEGQTADGIGWIEILPKGLLLRIKEKTGWRIMTIERGSSKQACPVAALETWLRLGRIAHGPVFRRLRQAGGGVGTERMNDRHVARLVQTVALATGVRGDLTEGQREHAFAGHSLRAGFAASVEVDEAHVPQQLDHASPEMTRRSGPQRDRSRVNLTKTPGL